MRRVEVMIFSCLLSPHKAKVRSTYHSQNLEFKIDER